MVHIARLRLKAGLIVLLGTLGAFALGPTPESDAAQRTLAAGGGQAACSVSADHALVCWGSHVALAQQSPTVVSGLESGVEGVADASNHVCVIVAGGVKCFGAGNNGRLGADIGAPATSTPQDVTGLGAGSSVTELAVGDAHSCALVAGGVKCWGLNADGQRGDGANDSGSSTPSGVIGLGAGSGVVAITAGSHHTCAVVSGGAKCWGWNALGQLGLGSGNNTSANTPQDVAGLAAGSDVTAIAASGARTCAVVAGGVKCWGDGIGGAPTDVAGLAAGSGVTAVAVGSGHACAIAGLVVKCWGAGGKGQLGNGHAFDSATPQDVTLPGTWTTQLAASGDFTCAQVSGAVKCWGYNSSGQLGDGTLSLTALSPVSVPSYELFATTNDVSVGSRHACFVRNSKAYCWGEGTLGQLGAGDNGNSSSPQLVPDAGTSVVAVAAGESHSCALNNSGAVTCWGLGTTGQNGLPGTNSNTAHAVSGVTSGVSAITAGYDHSCAIENAAAWCWGRNNQGQLGYTYSGWSYVAFAVQGLSGAVTSLSAGLQYTCAVAGGAARCWGYNASGQLGNGSTTFSQTPVEPTGLGSGVTAIAASSSGSHSCAIKDANVWCWGANDQGQLGDGTTSGKTTPVQVTTSGNASLVTVGAAHTCAILGGAAYCWGDNSYGQLGDGTGTDQLLPTLVSGLTGNVYKISAGNRSTCARVKVTNPVPGFVVKCWGDGSKGQLGDGRAWSTAPLAISPLTPLDTTAPVITIDSPTNGAALAAGSAQVAFTASDDAGAPSLTCAIDAATPSPCSSPWSTPALTPGGHVVGVTATDAGGNASSASIVVTATAPPANGGAGSGPGAGAGNGSGGGQSKAIPQILKAPRTSKPGRAIKLVVACPEGCKISLRMKIGRKRMGGLKSVKLAAGATSASVKFTRKVTRSIRSALRKRRSAKIILRLTPSGPAGTGAVKSVRIR